ncbi:hypothetical protein NS341_13440, partial [Staphylococcus xylosus]
GVWVPAFAGTTRGEGLAHSVPVIARVRSATQSRASSLRSKLAAIEPGLAGHLVGQFLRARCFIGRHRRGLRDPVFTLHREALRNRRAPGQYAVEIGIVPVCREMNPAVVEQIAIDHAGQRGERQVEPVDRMCEEQLSLIQN